MISENYEGKVIGGKVIDSVGVVSELNVIHVNFSDNTFERYGSVETLEAAIDKTVTGSIQEKSEEEIELERAAEIELKRQQEEDAEIQRQTEEEEAKKTALTEVEVAKYELLEEIPYTDEEGNELGKSEIGSIREVPVELGDAWVEQGKAVKVTSEVNETK